jgi:hypothetical protein
MVQMMRLHHQFLWMRQSIEKLQHEAGLPLSVLNPLKYLDLFHALGQHLFSKTEQQLREEPSANFVLSQHLGEYSFGCTTCQF